jgi:hypothetical protein
MKQILLALNVIKKAGNVFKILSIIESTAKHVMGEIETHFPDTTKKVDQIEETV